MTDQTRTTSDSLAADMLRINIEASIRCGTAPTPRLMGYHANAAAASWAAFRLINALKEVAPEVAQRLTAELIDDLSDGDYQDAVEEYSELLGVDVDAIADRVESESA